MNQNVLDKLAEEYAQGKGHEHYHFLFEENAGNPVDFAKLCYKDGYQDGLNSNRWHYPSKGEYPPKGRQILAYAWNVHNVLAKYDTFDGKDRFVTFDAYNGYIEIKKVIRWQYIVPPKEEA